jgi:solute carrier family 25 carnitine/acylcarnitine transporter 20/29
MFLFLMGSAADVCLLCHAAAFTSVTGAVRAALTHNGIRGPFQALGPTILRNAPANSIYLGSFEVLKQQFAEYKGIE